MPHRHDHPRQRLRRHRRRRAPGAHATIFPCGPFPTGDGKMVMLGVQNEREWQISDTQVLEQPALAI